MAGHAPGLVVLRVVLRRLVLVLLHGVVELSDCPSRQELCPNHACTSSRMRGGVRVHLHPEEMPTSRFMVRMPCDVCLRRASPLHSVRFAADPCMLVVCLPGGRACEAEALGDLEAARAEDVGSRHSRLPRPLFEMCIRQRPVTYRLQPLSRAEMEPADMTLLRGTRDFK